MTKDANPNLALRIKVESGGCHGFQYLMSLTTLPSPLPSDPSSLSSQAASTTTTRKPDEAEVAGEVTPSTTTSNEPSAAVLAEDDTVLAFVKESEGNVGGEADLVTSPKIVLDQPSLELLKGSKVDFTMELIGSQFKIVDNPAASSSCGCGTSFDIKI